MIQGNPDSLQFKGAREADTCPHALSLPDLEESPEETVIIFKRFL